MHLLGIPFFFFLISNLDAVAVVSAFREHLLEKIYFSQDVIFRNVILMSMHLIAKILENKLYHLLAYTKEKFRIDLFLL